MRVTQMTDAELQYAASDLRTTIAITHPSHYSNMDRYLIDYRAVMDEQHARDTKRTFRRMLQSAPLDPLSPLKFGRTRPGFNRLENHGDYWSFARKQAHSAAWQLGWIRKHNIGSLAAVEEPSCRPR